VILGTGDQYLPQEELYIILKSKDLLLIFEALTAVLLNI